MGSVDGEFGRKAPTPDPPESMGCVADTSGKPDRGQALAEAFRKFHTGLVRMLSVRTGSIEDAKEIMQEAYARVLALHRPETVSVLPGYLWRIAVNLATDRRRQQALQEAFCRSTQSFSEGLAVSAESTVESRERLSIVEQAIDELPPRCLEAFVLHVLNGLTFDEVGREMRISARMAQKHVARALEYLQACLDAADGVGEPL